MSKKSKYGNNRIILNKMKNGSASPDEVGHLLSYTQDMDSLMKEISADPNMQKNIGRFMESPQAQYYTNKISNWGGVVKDLAGIGIGMGQISQSNNTLKGLKKPDALRPFQENKNLSSAIDQARLRYESPELAGMLSPYKRELGDAYRNQLASVATASGGQAGALGAGAQAAYTSRLKAAERMPAMASDMTSKSAQMYANLLGQSVRQDQTKAMYDLNRGRQMYNRYQTESQAAGALGQAGRLNLYNSGVGLMNDMAPIVGDYMGRQRYSGISPQVDGYEAEINDSMLRREPLQAPSYSGVFNRMQENARNMLYDYNQ